ERGTGGGLHLVKFVWTARGEICVSNCDFRIGNCCNEEPDVGRCVTPVGHNVPEMKVCRNRFDFRRDNRPIPHFACDPHEPASIKWKSSEILCGDWDDLLLVIDEYIFCEGFNALEDALSLRHFSGGAFPRLRAAALSL